MSNPPKPKVSGKNVTSDPTPANKTNIHRNGSWQETYSNSITPEQVHPALSDMLPKASRKSSKDSNSGN